MTRFSEKIRPFSSSSLKTRVTLFTLAIFVVSTIALAYWAGRMLHEDMRRLLSEQQFAAVSGIAAQINDDVQDRLGALESIAKILSPALLGNAAALQANLEQRAVLQKLFNRGVFVTGADGIAIASVPVSAGRTGLNFMDKEHVVTALKEGRANIGPPTIGKTLGAPVMVMAVPVRNNAGNVIGALMGATDLGKPSFLDKVADNRFGKTGGYVLIDPKYRQIITAGDKRRMMEILPAPGVNPSIDRFISGYEGTAIFVNPLGVKVFAVAKRIPAAGWYVAVQQPYNDAFAPIQEMEHSIIIATVLMTLLVGGLMWWMLRRELSPMFGAISAMAAVSTADMPLMPLPVARDDEIGQLISGFNRLLALLADREASSKQAESRLAMIARRVPGMVYQFRLRPDGSSCFPYASDGIREIYQVSPEEVREDASKVFGILHPDDYNAFAESIQQSARDLSNWQHEYRVKFADGSVRWLLGNAIPQREEDGATLWQGFITDISDRKSAEQGLVESELRLRMAMRGGDLGLWDLNVTANQLTVDARWRSMFGMAPLGPMPTMALCKTLVHADDLPEFERAIGQIIHDRSQPEFEIEIRVRHVDGHYFWAQKNGAVVERNVDGLPTRIAGTLKDIHERKKIEQEARAQWDFATQIVDAMGQGLSVTSADGHFEFVNPALATLLGYEAHELVGKTGADVFVAEDFALQTERLASRVAGVSSTYEAHFKRRDGSVFPVLITATPRRLNGEFVGSIAVITNLTDRKRMEQAVKEERDFASQVISSMGQGLAVTNTSRQLEFVNQAFAEMLGYSVDELKGRYAADLVVPADKTLQAAHQSERREGVSSAYEISLMRRDGSILPVQILGVPRLVDGQYAGSIAVVTDLTERKRTEKILQESEKRFRMLIESSPEASVVHSDGKVVYANPAALALYGAAHENELVGRQIVDFVHRDSLQAVLARVKAINEGATIQPIVELKNIKLDGTVIEIESQSVATVFDGQPAIRLSIRDVTARNRAEAERASLEAQLRESQKMQAIGTLAGGVAHDFNNILAAILGNVELARQDIDPDHKALDSLGEIRKAATRARDLVQQILSFSRRQATDRRAIDLAPVIEESRRLLRATLPARLSLDMQCAADTPLVMADATQIQQAVINLATNAMQAMPNGPGRIEIKLDKVDIDAVLAAKNAALTALYQQQARTVARLVVRDNGPGMSADIVARIFEPFFTTKPVNEGTGLGLSVVHGIIEAHDGAIIVESQPGAGTTFTIYLPAAHSLQVPEPAQPASKIAEPATMQADGSRVMYIDDDESMVYLVGRMLARRGCRVSSFVDQSAALAALRADPAGFDVLVTDYNMPGMSGIDVAREVRLIRIDLPVAIASGFIDDALREAAEKVGVQELIFKENITEGFCDAVMKLTVTSRQRG